jgi:hypothetical protein
MKPQTPARPQMGERTLRRWLTEDSEFKAEYEAARSVMFQVGMSRIQALAGRAVETLEDLASARASSTRADSWMRCRRPRRAQRSDRGHAPDIDARAHR